jgi:glucose-1-phosphate adenylyltransferase
MDYRPMLAYHVEKNADLTVGVIDVPPEETHRFGIMTVNRNMRITEFHEKPDDPEKGTLASMGFYIFNTDVLAQRLTEGSAESPRIDFGKDVIPNMINHNKVYAYAFEGYWVDVGTLQAYWETNLALTDSANNALNLHDPKWIIHTRSEERPPVKLGPQAQVVNSLVSNGCVIRGRVERSVLSPGVYVSPGALVRESVIINDTWIGPGAVVDRSIVDANVVIGTGSHVGYGDDMTPNHELPDKVNTGITVVGSGTHVPGGVRIGRNVLINCDRQETEFPGIEIPSGETV